MSGIGFPGAPYEHVFFVADTEAVGPMVPGQLNVYLWRRGFHLYFPMKGTNRWRVIGILPEHMQNNPALTFDDLAPTLVDDSAPGLRFKSCGWFSTYRIHHRCTEHFRDRRCFLLGDAAHIHSPMGGQGMNTGLQDAYNLAWKLALVVSGRADGSLLDSYEAERAPVAHRLLATTDRAFNIVVSDHWLAAILRTRIMGNVAAVAMSQRWIQRRVFKTISQIGISYRETPLARTLDGVAAKAPRAGDRFPWLQLRFEGEPQTQDLFARLDDTRFNLLVIGQPAPSHGQLACGDLVDVHAVSSDGETARELARAGIARSSYYLLRPDGHVALGGTRLDVADVNRWFADAGVDGASSMSGNMYRSGHAVASHAQRAQRSA
jgi:hypothetical protein